MKETLDAHEFVLMAAAIVERLRRMEGVDLHPRLANALLVYDEGGKEALNTLYKGYFDIAAKAGLPILVGAPTWRANKERMDESGITKDANGDSIRFIKEVRDAQPAGAPPVLVAGVLGCKNDCYRPEEGLSRKEAEAFHTWQIERLSAAQPDYLEAATLPSVEEAIGIAHAMAKTDLPYIISFVINRDGKVMDGTPIFEAIQTIDREVSRPPEGYMVNCAYPTFLCAADQPPALFDRLIAFQANASAKDHSDLDGAVELHAETVENWGREMISLHRHGVKVLGGCCGTDGGHLEYLVKNI